MLVLSRKSNESIVIGASNGFERLLKLTVIRISGGTVRLGIEVADDVPVHCPEIPERLRACGAMESWMQAGKASAAKRLRRNSKAGPSKGWRVSRDRRF